MHRKLWSAIVLSFALLLPAMATAQGALARGTLTGTVRDASGAVLPGVTVEAASPALIEKSRTAVTDNAGVYRIVNLDPGVYSLTFTLQGFSQVKREDIELVGSATLTIPADLKVGSLQETVVVTGESPVVDVQSTRREVVVGGEVIQTLPGTRSTGSLITMIPGVETTGAALNPSPQLVFMNARGGPSGEGRFNVNGMPVANAFAGGGGSSLVYDTVNVDEIAFTVAGGMGETDVGGPVLNIVPRSGSNKFQGQAFINFSNDSLRGNNLTPELMAPTPGPNLRETPGIIKAYDANISYGGPIVRDRLWFFGSYRKLNTETAVEGIVGNANAFDLSKWNWVADPSLTSRQSSGRSIYIGRFTSAITSKQRVSANWEHQVRCDGSPLKEETDGCHTRGANWVGAGTNTSSPEAALAYLDVPYTVVQGRWTDPMTTRLLLEAGGTYYSYVHAGGFLSLPPDGIFDIGVTELSTAINPATGTPYAPRANYNYRALSEYRRDTASPNNWNASASYVTGSHNMKVGYQGAYQAASTVRHANPTLLSYNFTQGVPTAFTVRIPEWGSADRTWTQSFFAQDTWTRGRVTVQGALRYDHAWSYSPAGLSGTNVAAPQLGLSAITFPRTPSVDAFNDITPRFGVAYDVFGTGKTALKFSAGRYLGAATNGAAYTRNNPANRIVNSVNRGWTDDGDKVVECDLSILTLNGECAALTGNNLNFGAVSGNITQVNQDTLKGWGARDYDWQWSIGLQQQVLPRVSADVAYSRRSFYSFTVTDNQARDPSQYDAWTINAPPDPRLPGGGGYPITLYTPTAAAAAIPAKNYITWETDFGPARSSYWQGVDFTVNARIRRGLTLQLGTNTGRKIDDTCATVVKIDSPDPRDCRLTPPYQTTVRGLASYTVPRVDVLVSATIRSQPPLPLTATWPVPNTVVSQILGRIPPGGTAGGTTSVALLDNEHRLYADNRRSQLDMRFAKIFRFAGKRVDVGVDLENLLNTNYATNYDSTYQFSTGNTGMGGTWNNPTAIYTPRFARFNFTVNF
jgi:hypothetical protein